MRSFVYIFLFIAVSSASFFGHKAAVGTSDPTKEVKAAFDTLIDGIRQADAAKVMSADEKAYWLVLFNNNRTATIGWEIMNSNRQSFYAKTKSVSLEVTGLRVEMLGKTAAYATC